MKDEQINATFRLFQEMEDQMTPPGTRKHVRTLLESARQTFVLAVMKDGHLVETYNGHLITVGTNKKE